MGTGLNYVVTGSWCGMVFYAWLLAVGGAGLGCAGTSSWRGGELCEWLCRVGGAGSVWWYDEQLVGAGPCLVKTGHVAWADFRGTRVEFGCLYSILTTTTCTA